ncbi:tetratricopeptide repeat protein 12 [Synchiropus splendidus]|uniref:tetratricopeptide repeat protein 12 n=1 Tax=Synchiropus splendidus TaxID=270530 RepID=UPI00237E57BF|nr:tetratricopeptide repeat protein 12 [Synchiropus splendidus]
MDQMEDFESFLQNVDKISDLVKDLSSTRAEVRQKALQKADQHLADLDGPCRTKLNRTAINTKPPSCNSTSKFEESADNFMKIMEKDIEDRKKMRKAKEEKATALKEEGNKAFAQDDYERAVEHYSAGLAHARDMQQLYTNRAQAYIKLRKYKEAISDCEWAIKCNERCTKAYLHMGKAHLALKSYDEARSCFEKIVEIEPKWETKMQEHLTKVDLEEKREIQEHEARRELKQGGGKAASVPQLLEKLSAAGQMPLYYHGGMEVLSRALNDCTAQTLFRLHNGFSIISSSDAVRSCLQGNIYDHYTQELCVTVLKLWRIVCHGNEENQKMLVMCPISSQAMVHLLSSELPAVQEECLALMFSYSDTPHGRRLVIEHLHLSKLVSNIMGCITTPQGQRENTAVKILQNLVSEKRFCCKLRDVLKDSITSPFSSMLTNINEATRHVLPPLLDAVGSLALDDVIRHALAHDPASWEAFLVALKQCAENGYRETLYPLLGLMINIATVQSSVIKEHATSLSEICCNLLKDSDGGIITRATGVLSAALRHSSEAVQGVTRRDVVPTLCRLLKGNGQTAAPYAIRTLAICTASSRGAREELLKSDKKLSVLRGLLRSSRDESELGNAALCLLHCLEMEGLASKLLGTDIVPLLLRHAAADAKKSDVQLNAAIALSKLCQLEPRHKNTLRELHGFEILHSCTKFMA